MSEGLRVTPPRPASQSEITAGGVVRDRHMAYLGTIESVARSTAVVRHGRGQTAVVPLSAFWNLNGNLALAVSRGDFGRIATAAAIRSEDSIEAEDDQAE